MVWMNDHMYSHGACQCAWGGVKHSGIGRSHSKFGFYECVNVKQMAWEPSRTRNFWWHPYDASLGKAMDASAKLLYGRDADKLGGVAHRGGTAHQAGGKGSAPRLTAICSLQLAGAGRPGVVANC